MNHRQENSTKTINTELKLIITDKSFRIISDHYSKKIVNRSFNVKSNSKKNLKKLQKKFGKGEIVTTLQELRGMLFSATKVAEKKASKILSELDFSQEELVINEPYNRHLIKALKRLNENKDYKLTYKDTYIFRKKADSEEIEDLEDCGF